MVGLARSTPEYPKKRFSHARTVICRKISARSGSNAANGAKRPPPPRTDVHKSKTVLLIPDFSDPYPLYPKILEQYLAQDRHNEVLLIYIAKPEYTPQNLRVLEHILKKYEERDCDVILQTGETLDEHILFQYADCFVTTRSRETVFRTCLADLYHTKILYGTDDPIFTSEETI